MGRLTDDARPLEAPEDTELLQGAQILEVLEAGVLVMDSQGVVTRCNGAAGRLMGVDPDGVVGGHLPLATGPSVTSTWPARSSWRST
jgi:PAS domain-containing protein